ncbi:MAG: hypothetical protein A4E49_02381 [Methanosaeta sp. PtaU1.Bin112]|nr:MAG: hypothetical protein A4E49_02381 [Methanosaeta sp. PtaU1.Bin112]
MKKRDAPSLPHDFAMLAPALLILSLMIAGAYAASTNMDIDYSHNVIGTGTVMTDFKMGSEESTQATGRIRGSGEVVNKYVFLSNNSENISIEDQFLFTKMPVAHEITIRDYPQMKIIPGSFRLLGTSWASKISLNDSEEND